MYSTGLITTYNELVSLIPEYQIYESLLGPIDFNRAYRSPIPRGQDGIEKTASLRLKVINNRILWRDYGLSTQKGSSPIDLLQHLTPGLSYIDALNKVYDQLQSKVNPFLFNVPLPESSKVPTKLVFHRNYQQYHTDYYKQGGIKESTLKKFQVFIGDSIHYNKRLWHQDCKEDPLFIYMFNSEDSVWIAYRPLVPKEQKKEKFRNNNASNVIYGIKQLPRSGPVAIITSSGKDCMVNYEIDMPAVANISETYLLPPDVMHNLQCRFKTLYVLLNNDYPGLTAALQYLKHYNVKPIVIPMSAPKDPFDFSKGKGLSDYAIFLYSILW